MADSAKPNTAQLLSEIQKGTTLKKAETIHTVDTVGQLKLQKEIEKGVALKKVPRPSTELSEAARQAFVEQNQK